MLLSVTVTLGFCRLAVRPLPALRFCLGMKPGVTALSRGPIAPAATRTAATP